MINFLSDEGAPADVWGLEFDPIAGKRIGEPFRLKQFTGPGERIWNAVRAEMGVGRGWLAIPLVHPTGNIWLLDHFKR